MTDRIPLSIVMATGERLLAYVDVSEDSAKCYGLVEYEIGDGTIHFRDYDPACGDDFIELDESQVISTSIMNEYFQGLFDKYHFECQSFSDMKLDYLASYQYTDMSVAH